MVCPICCTGHSTVKVIPTPEGYGPAPPKIPCQQCSKIVESNYRQLETVYSLCFVCRITSETAQPYIACTGCGNSLGSLVNNCQKCGLCSSINCKYCMSCGEKL
ncbi:hypothetical protein PAPHI01_1848 [Pancytospora philotis]|nr:hypothetical protein PAPHI01_1848 [Pancytospora philotis]